MRATVVQILATFVLFASFESARSIHGCNCTRTHPQQHYCRANYVIRGRVVLLRWELIPDLMPETATIPVTDHVTHPPTERTTHTQITEPRSTKPDGNTTQEILATPTPSSDSPNPEFPDAMPAYRQGSQLADRLEKHLRRDGIISQEPWNYELIYIVTVQDVYKQEGGARLRKGMETEIRSPHPGMGFCGVELKAGKTYLLGGSTEGQITMCDWVEEYRAVSKLHKRGLKRKYWKSCDKCQIDTCPEQGCATNLPPTTCAYQPPSEDFDRQGIGYMASDCYARRGRCMPKGKKGVKCYWASKELNC